MGKLFILAAFLIITPLFLLFNVFLLLSFSQNKPQLSLFGGKPKQNIAYAALPTAQNVFSTEIDQKDARVESVRQFLAKYDSPLEPYAQNVVSAAAEYDLDYRLIPAIAMQESNLCKKVPVDSNNCWGFGIYGKMVRRFSGYSEGIEVVTKTLAQSYKNNGLVTPEEIMTKYTPSNDGSWARSVNHFMDQIQ